MNARRCFGCGTNQKIVHFWLTAKATTPDGRPTTRGAGTIDLCEKCWRDACRSSRTNRRKSRRFATT